MHDVADILLRIPTLGKEGNKFLKIGNGVQVVGTLLFAKGPVKVGPDTHVQSIARKLADMVNVVDKRFQAALCAQGRRFSPFPARDHHPCI